MTTIAYRDGVLAGDTRETVGEAIVSDNIRKVFKMSDGRLFAGVGSAEQCDILLNAVRKHKTPEGLNEIEAVLVYPDGTVWVTEGKVWMKRPKKDYIGLGTGGVAALAAMDAGATAVQAVRIGIKRDTNSGGRVQSVRLKG